MEFDLPKWGWSKYFHRLIKVTLGEGGNSIKSVTIITSQYIQISKKSE
jgi:hypothetical protein